MGQGGSSGSVLKSDKSTLYIPFFPYEKNTDTQYFIIQRMSPAMPPLSLYAR